MASTQRSNIELFFHVLGAERVRKAFADVSSADTGVASTIAGVDSTMGTSSSN